MPSTGTWVVALDSDAPVLGGYGRVAPGVEFVAEPQEFAGRPASALVYTPARTAIVLRRK